MSAHHEPGYVRALADQLELATEFRVPCPSHPYGRSADLHVVKRGDGRGDGWAITDTPHGGQVWTGQQWADRSDLHRDDIYRWTRQQALDEAHRIAPAVVTRLHDHLRREDR